MKRILIYGAFVACAAMMSGRPVAAQDVKQQLAAAKQAAADNQKALRSYAWTEKTEIFMKGELKTTKVESCRYGPDGKVQKTPVVEPPAKEKARGLKGRIIANKVEDLSEEVKATVALIHQYVPPDPNLMQTVMTAGTASATPSGANVALKFPGYLKAGDALTLTFEKAVRSLRQIDIATWVEKPEEPATLRVTMQSLPDGTSHPANIVLAMPHNKLEVRITKSNYQKIAQ